MICKNLKDLEKQLQKCVNKALATNVADVVRDTMTDHIWQDVYDVYNPVMYERRYNNDGLGDPDNINVTIEGQTLVVENNAKGNPHYDDPYGTERTSKNAGKDIAGVIETGKGYDIHGWEYDDVPRPFIENTREDLKQNKYHIKAFKQGLKDSGLEVK